MSTTRLSFLPNPHPQHKQPWPDWAMPVHSLLRVETDNQKNTKNQVVRSVTLQCKDGQVRRFSMVQTDGSNKVDDKFHSFMRKVFQWAYCNEEEFARRLVIGWGVYCYDFSRLPTTSYDFLLLLVSSARVVTLVL